MPLCDSSAAPAWMTAAMANDQVQPQTAQYQIVDAHRDEPHGGVPDTIGYTEYHIEEICGHTLAETDTAAESRIVYIPAAEGCALHPLQYGCPDASQQTGNGHEQNDHTVRRQTVDRICRYAVCLPGNKNVSEGGKDRRREQ